MENPFSFSSWVIAEIGLAENNLAHRNN